MNIRIIFGRVKRYLCELLAGVRHDECDKEGVNYKIQRCDSRECNHTIKRRTEHIRTYADRYESFHFCRIAKFLNYDSESHRLQYFGIRQLVDRCTEYNDNTVAYPILLHGLTRLGVVA